jgi:hypothetical protein
MNLINYLLFVAWALLLTCFLSIGPTDALGYVFTRSKSRKALRLYSEATRCPIWSLLIEKSK